MQSLRYLILDMNLYFSFIDACQPKTTRDLDTIAYCHKGEPAQDKGTMGPLSKMVLEQFYKGDFGKA